MAPAMTMKYLMLTGMERGSRVQQQIQSRLTDNGSDLFKVEVVRNSRGNDGNNSEIIDGAMLRWARGKAMMAMMASKVPHA